MKTHSSSSGNTVRQAVLAGILALTGSAGLVADTPDAPFIDWVDATEHYSDNDDYVLVDVGWSRYDFEEVSSVQYRVDGVPVMSHHVDATQVYGSDVIPLPLEGVHELTVALCHADGCDVSSPVTISSPDIDAPTSTRMNRAELSREFERILASTEMLEFKYGEPRQEPAPAVASFGLISILGKAALSGFVSAGGDFAFLTLMNHLGMGSDGFGAQIDQLQSSMNALNSQVAELTLAIENLQDTTNWQGFLNQHKDANIAANLVYANFGHVTGWIENNVQVDAFAWTTARKNIADALTILGGAKMSAAGGIVDSRDGAIYQLMNAIPQRVASTESYWPLVDEYRDYYRAALAIGFLGLDLIEDHFDGSGTTRVLADDALQVSQRAVLAMYTYGVAPAVPESMDFVQLRGSVDGYASTAFAAAGGGAVTRLAGPQLRSAFAQMANDYRPEHHGGLTFEAFLANSGLPGIYVIDHTGGWNSTGWQVTQTSAGKPHLGQPPTYNLRPLVGRVSGNQWIESYEPFCSVTFCLEGVSAMTQQQLQWFIDDGKFSIRHRGGYNLDYRTFAVSHYGAINLTDRLNHAGRAAEFDPQAVREAAFGESAE